MTGAETHRTKVGIFVLTGIALCICAILILGGSKSLFAKTAIIHARFENVLGLNIGSIVSLAGVPIGNVNAINFISEENKLDLAMKVDASFLTRITEGTGVEIRTQGALGDKFVYIMPGDPRNKVIPADAIVLEATKGGDFLGMLSEKSNEAAKIFDIISESEKLMRTFNDGNRVDKVLNNFLEASSQMSKAATELRQMVADTSPALKDSALKMDKVIKKIDSGEGTLGALINDPTIHDQIKVFLGGASNQKKTIKSLLRNSVEKVDE